MICMAKGSIVWISGPAVQANGMSEAKMYETVSVGNSKLIGEVIRLTGDVAFSKYGAMSTVRYQFRTSGMDPGNPPLHWENRASSYGAKITCKPG